MSALTREQWLALVTARLRTHFRDTGAEDLPQNVRASCGFPSRSALARRTRRVGECWTDGASADKTFEIFVSPLLADGLMVAATLAHECVHATVGLAAKHGAKFRTLARAIGLDGKMTATVPGEAFKQWYASQNLPPYPHGALTPNAQRTVQSTRLLKVECPQCAAEGEPYIARMSAKTLERGAPLCPIPGDPMEVAPPAGAREGE